MAASIILPVLATLFVTWIAIPETWYALLETIFSILAAILFLAGTWLSIETRTLLTDLETIQIDGRKLLAVKRSLVTELSEDLLRHIRLEWKCYLAGTACLTGYFSLFVLRTFFAA